MVKVWVIMNFNLGLETLKKHFYAFSHILLLPSSNIEFSKNMGFIEAQCSLSFFAVSEKHM